MYHFIITNQIMDKKIIIKNLFFHIFTDFIIFQVRFVGEYPANPLGKLTISLVYSTFNKLCFT